MGYRAQSIDSNERFLRIEVSSESFLVQYKNKSTFGCATPLGRPRSVYNSDIECHFLLWNGQMTLKVSVNDTPPPPSILYQAREPQDANLVEIC